MDFRVLAFTSHEKQSELMVRSLYQIGHVSQLRPNLICRYLH